MKRRITILNSIFEDCCIELKKRSNHTKTNNCTLIINSINIWVHFRDEWHKSLDVYLSMKGISYLSFSRRLPHRFSYLIGFNWGLSKGLTYRFPLSPTPRIPLPCVTFELFLLQCATTFSSSVFAGSSDSQVVWNQNPNLGNKKLNREMKNENIITKHEPRMLMWDPKWM